MIYNSIVDCVGHTPLVRLSRCFADEPVEVLAKVEFLNPGGSVKDRPARFIVEQGLRDGTITANTHLVEASSGNFAIALAMVSQLYGLPLTVVVDPLITLVNLHILERFGAIIDMVTEPDDQGSYLKTRLRRVHELLATLPNVFWPMQHDNALNWRAHYEGEGGEILASLDRPIDVLALAVSTTGTIMGIARRLREAFPRLHVVAIDAVGSVIFGAPSVPRKLPGIGASRVPGILVPDEIDQVVYVNDREAAIGCRRLLATEAIFAGGSSGAAIAGISKLIPTLPAGTRLLTLLPDRGSRYLDTVYDDAWMSRLLTSVPEPLVTAETVSTISSQAV